MSRFVHNHVHTVYSFLDGYNPIKKLVSRAKELGMEALAITDHNHLCGCPAFQRECKAQGVKPLLGCEMYWTWDTDIAKLPIEERSKNAIARAATKGLLPGDIPLEINPRTGKPKKQKQLKKSEIKEIIAPFLYDMRQYHILLLAINQTGWRNLVKLQSEAAQKCTYNGRFLCDDAMLAKYSEGLVMTSACIGNAAPALIEQAHAAEAEALILGWKAIFGERFFLEIQPLDIEKQRCVNYQYMQWSQKHCIRVIATNDVHWTHREDYDDHDTLLCIATGKFKEEKNRMRYSDDFWLKTETEMTDSFETQARSLAAELGEGFDETAYEAFYKQAMDNSTLIADMAEEIALGSPAPLFPKIEVPSALTAMEWLTLKCFNALFSYAKERAIDLERYLQRLNEELQIIEQKGFESYMLTVEEYVDWANRNGCPTGPGRGSAAGSLVLFLLNITKCIDPIEHNLLFSRFLTLDRTSPPDIDVDFCYTGRSRVIDHLKQLHGSDKVAHIGTITEMGVKSGLKDVGRVLRMDFGEMNAISRKLDEILDKPQPKFRDFDDLKESDNSVERRRWREFANLELKYKELFRLARAFEGIPRNMGVHASGVLVTPMPVSHLFPTRRISDGSTVTLYTGAQLEELNAIKFDLLGLRTITVIKNALRYVDPALTFEDLYARVDVNDPKIFRAIRKKQTDGLFQIESDMFKGIIGDVMPDCMNDIIAITALGRPGPLRAGMPADYADRKNARRQAAEPLRGTWEIVKDTFGCICYQEQIMQIAVSAASFNANQSDSIVRKIFAKKKKDQMEKLRRMFFFGKINAEGPKGWEDDENAPWYDSEGTYGDPIAGTCNNGYAKLEIAQFWKSIEGFADYLFNKSHAAGYSYITMLTAHLKLYHPVEYMAALLSMEDNSEGMQKYIAVAERMGIRILTPDLNRSGESFTPNGKTILFGLGAIKGIGTKALPDLLAGRPYQSLEDIFARMPKRVFNRSVGKYLIMAGALDWISSNRYQLLNRFYQLRGDKDAPMPSAAYSEKICIEMEKEALGTSITYKPWWETIAPGSKISESANLLEVDEHVDKKGNMMAFAVLRIKGCKVKAVIFASVYCRNVDKFDLRRYRHIVVEGTKDEKSTLIVKKVFLESETKMNQSMALRSSSFFS